MPEVAEQQEQVEQEPKTEQPDGAQSPKRNFTQEEWDARQKEFDGKANKIRRNAAREAELKFRREMDARREQPQQRQHEQAAEPKEPKREDFADYEEYLKGLAKFAGESAAREQRKKDEKEAGEKQAADQTQQQLREFKKNLDAVVAELPEFEELLDAASEENLNLPPSMGEAIREAGVTGARVLHYLLANRAELDRIMELKSGTAQAKAIGKIENKIEAELEAAKQAKEKKEPKDENDGEQQRAADDANDDEEREERPRGEGGRFKAPEQETRRKAPDPIEPVSGRGGNTSTAPSDKDTDEVWHQKRQAELARENEAIRKRRAG